MRRIIISILSHRVQPESCVLYMIKVDAQRTAPHRTRSALRVQRARSLGGASASDGLSTSLLALLLVAGNRRCCVIKWPSNMATSRSVMTQQRDDDSEDSYREMMVMPGIVGPFGEHVPLRLSSRSQAVRILWTTPAAGVGSTGDTRCLLSASRERSLNMGHWPLRSLSGPSYPSQLPESDSAISAV